MSSREYISDIEYLAIPYLDEDPKVMDFRAEISDMVYADLAKQGRFIYAPISSCHHIAKKYGLPRDWEFWKHMDEELVRICKTLIIVKLDGWKISTGVTAEIEIAKKYNIPIEDIDPEKYLIQLGKY